MIRRALIAALGLGIAACEGGGDPVRQAQMEALAKNQAVAIDATNRERAARPKAETPPATSTTPTGPQAAAN